MARARRDRRLGRGSSDEQGSRRNAMSKPNGGAELQAAEVLAVLDGWKCGGCGGEIERTGGEWACPGECARNFCPHCGHDANDGTHYVPCVHLLASPNPDFDPW